MGAKVYQVLIESPQSNEAPTCCPTALQQAPSQQWPLCHKPLVSPRLRLSRTISCNFKHTNWFQCSQWNQISYLVYIFRWPESTKTAKAGDREATAQRTAAWKERKAVRLTAEDVHLSGEGKCRQNIVTALKIMVKWSGRGIALQVSETQQREDDF